MPIPSRPKKLTDFQLMRTGIYTVQDSEHQYSDLNCKSLSFSLTIFAVSNKSDNYYIVFKIYGYTFRGEGGGGNSFK